VLLFPAVARSDSDDDLKKEIADTEKRLEELKKKLEELKKGKPAAPAPDAIPQSVVARMNWRCVGPANMSGRITALAVVESDPATYYVATASGGLLKTTNNGTTFTFAFDREATVSIGDVAVAPSNPNVVYVGTGENNPRNSVSYGDGVYKSTDAGKTWQNVGLRQSFSVGKIVIHPKDPNTVYVAAMGRMWGPGEERGVFKTEDGGKSWKKVLYADDKTGAIELRMDPFDPNTLLAGLWEQRRDEFDGYFGESDKWPSPDPFGPAVAYGPGGGLFKTTDAGKTWKKLSGEKAVSGLPTVKTGRIGLDYSRKTKGLVYAIIDTESVGKGRVVTVSLGIAAKDAKDGAGAEVTAVVDDGPAAKAGVRADDLVTAADGKKVASFGALLDALEDKKPGDALKLTVSRKGKDKKDAEKLDFEVKLEARKAEPPKTKGQQTLSPGGIVLTFSEDAAAVKVAEVPKGGPAEKAGVKAGMTVVGVEGKDVHNWREFRTELRVSPKLENPRKAGEKVKVTFKEGDKKAFDVELPLAPAEVRGPAAPAAASNRPHLAFLSGQAVNVQNDQGKNGYQTGGVYVSRDNGETWTRVNSVNPRPFYFSQVRVDPTDDDTVYVLNMAPVFRSTNGGKQFDLLPDPEGTVHPDHHALWIDPKDGRHMLIGTDGGFYATYDRGATWDHLNTQALAQFYHVAVDNRKPYRVYGGLQDNGCWGGPSRTLRGTGPANEDWQFLNGGDGFVCRVDPHDPDWVYAESQNGFMNRRNLKTGEYRAIRPKQVKDGEELRFNWNTPYILSEHNPQIFYCGAQYVFRSVARGDSLKAISPELTRTKMGSMTALAESPRNADVLWAGTDDGYLWVTRDGGQNWQNVTEKLKAAGLPGHRWVSSIEPARRTEGRCYVCLDAHRSNDDRPYLFVTEDFGQSWKPVTGNLPAFGNTRVLREDLATSDTLYCGTEFGVWVSINRGETWAKLNNNLPTVAVHEIAQPTTASEIVVGTHGRGVWILDVASVRQMKPDVLKAPATLFAPATATRWHFAPGSFPYSRDVRKFYGTNPPPGGTVDYLLTAPAKEVALKILDVNGKEVSPAPQGRAPTVDGKTATNFRSLPGAAGFHRLQWFPPQAGAFRLVLVVDGKEFAQMATVENDPNAVPNAVLTDGPFLLGKGNNPKQERKGTPKRDERREEEGVTPFIPKSEE
jgi:photosystem II stability/assembly factor-like uncharacterized protein